MKNFPGALTGAQISAYNTSGNSHFPEPSPPLPHASTPALQLSPCTDWSPELIQLAAHAQHYLGCHLAPSTREKYARDWRLFQRWCKHFSRHELPADEATLALYLTDMAERRLTLSSLKRHLAAIKAEHDDAGYDVPTSSPVIKGILAGVSRTQGAPAIGAQALLPAMLQKLLPVLDATTLIGKRNRALLLLGFFGAFRCAELVGINVADLQWHDEGVVILLSRSKTDQVGNGRVVAIPYSSCATTCPVSAVTEWLRAAGITEGAIFRGMDQHGHLISARLSRRAVSPIIKHAAEAAGLDTTRLSSHSLRAGHCTAAARAGVPDTLIMRQTGHRSQQTMLKYIRLGILFHQNSATAIDRVWNTIEESEPC